MCRYISRPAVKRRDEGDDVQAEPEMRAPIVLEPLDFIARLAALVPPPRVHLTRFHGVFAAHAREGKTPHSHSICSESIDAERRRKRYGNAYQVERPQRWPR